MTHPPRSTQRFNDDFHTSHTPRSTQRFSDDDHTGRHHVGRHADRQSGCGRACSCDHHSHHVCSCGRHSHHGDLHHPGRLRHVASAPRRKSTHPCSRKPSCRKPDSPNHHRAFLYRHLCRHPRL